MCVPSLTKLSKEDCEVARLFSYVVDHDEGRSPNPSDGYCTLANCKFSVSGKRPNVIELARKGDWIVGTGGASRRSAGHGTIVYAMKVTDKLALAQYLARREFRNREHGYNHFAIARRFALVSEDFYYFGANAVLIPTRFNTPHPFEKAGRGFRSDFDEMFVERFERWLRDRSRRGVYGNPCSPPRPRQHS
jgi:hypothetical protein